MSHVYLFSALTLCILTLPSIMSVALYKSSGEDFQVNNMFEKSLLLHSIGPSKVTLTGNIYIIFNIFHYG